MMAVTHSAIAMGGVALLIPNSTNPTVMLAALIGSQIPDLDTTSSLIGRCFYPVARFIEERWRHRTITHSLLFTGLIGAAVAPAVYLNFIDWKTAAATILGHLLSIISDTATKSGAALFWPNPAMCVLGRNPNARLRTGSTAEYWVLCLAVIAIAIGVYLNDRGGLELWVSESLQLPQAVEQIYNESGSTNHIYIDVEGVRSFDRSPVNQRFFIIAQKRNGYLAQDKSGIYWIDDTGDIQPNRQTATVGATALTQVRVINFDDVDVTNTLNELMVSNPSSAIYLSGQLFVDAPEYLQAFSPPGQHKYIQNFGSSVLLDYCPLELAIKIFSEQFAIGRLETKIITPKPELL